MAEAVQCATGSAPVIGKWGFSTNGIATCGMFGVPTVGFGPGDERYAHTPDDQCPIPHLTVAALTYALFPQAWRARVSGTGAAGR
jgi:acetylornithine deacetylase/succinyl-diaminopimelate desuccinylase-like protein